jgi:catalase
VAILTADGVDAKAVAEAKRLLTVAGAMPKVVAPHGGTLEGADGSEAPVDFSLLTVGRSFSTPSSCRAPPDRRDSAR